jgi:hypothetical protein
VYLVCGRGEPRRDGLAGEDHELEAAELGEVGERTVGGADDEVVTAVFGVQAAA